MEIRDRIKELRRVPASALQPNPRNWRKHPAAQNAALLGILEDVGYAGAVLARESADGSLVLIDGHARAGLTPEALVPTLILDVTEAEADRLLASFDPIGAMAEMDRVALGDLLTEIGDVENERLSAFFNGLRTQVLVDLGEGLTDPDDVPPLPDQPQSRPGDLWLLGRHRLLCGDSGASQDIVRLMAGIMPRLLVTDPPYGVNYSSPGKRDESGHLRYADSGRRNQPITNDNLGEETPALWEAILSLWPLNGDAYIFSPPGPLMVLLAQAIGRAGIEHHQWLVWLKSRLVPGRGHYHYRHEHIFYGWKGRSSYNGSRTEDSIWEADKPPKSPEHPTMKPVVLIEKAVANSSNWNDVVVDPFLGSGTTLVACERLNRACYAMEIDPRYVDVSVRRWEAYTGQSAKLATGGG